MNRSSLTAFLTYDTLYKEDKQKWFFLLFSFDRCNVNKKKHRLCEYLFRTSLLLFIWKEHHQDPWKWEGLLKRSSYQSVYAEELVLYPLLFSSFLKILHNGSHLVHAHRGIFSIHPLSSKLYLKLSVFLLKENCHPSH